MLSSLRDQMCLLSSIEFPRFACRNDAGWFLYLSDEALAHRLSRYGSVSAIASPPLSAPGDIIFRPMRASRMEYVLIEWSNLNGFYPSYTSAGSFLESKMRDRFLPAESAI